MLAKIINHKGNKLVIEFEEDINPEYLKMLQRGQEGLVEVKLLDNEPRTLKQNALAHSLIKDIAESEGDMRHETKAKLKELYKDGYDADFSHSKASLSEATEWIEFLIEYVVKNGVQLPKRYSYLLEYEKFFYFSCKYRKCCVCGKPHAQIHHVEAVGNRYRNQVDHRQFPFASLCWIHHNVAHQIGVARLFSELLITPVYLDKETLIKIGITSNAQIMRLDEQYETEELFRKAVGG